MPSEAARRGRLRRLTKGAVRQARKVPEPPPLAPIAPPPPFLQQSAARLNAATAVLTDWLATADRLDAEKTIARARSDAERAVARAIGEYRAEIRVNVRYLDEWTQSDGLVALLPASGDIAVVVRMPHPDAFDALMQTASRALRTITRQNRAAAAKLRQSIAAVHAERRRVRASLAAWERYLAGDETEAPPPPPYLSGRRR